MNADLDAPLHGLANTSKLRVALIAFRTDNLGQEGQLATIQATEGA